jgi:predicted component of type VI protein secretion system
MFVCRLFHRDRPFEPLDTRMIADGQITLGRDPACDWPLPGADELISRVHCALSVEHGRLVVRDSSTNGVFLEAGERVPQGEPVAVRPGDSLRLGDYVVLVEWAPGGVDVDPLAKTVVKPAPSSVSVREPAPPRDHGGDGPLLDAFCEGAGLDASAFAGEEPADPMRRVGEIYRETVHGLAALMSERAHFKQAGGLDRTAIGASDNNPFKWASPKRVAEDLLCGGGDGFLSNAEAVRASFDDIRAHVAALSEASTAAADAALHQLSPAAIDAEAKAHGGGLLRGRAAVCWEIHNRRHAELVQDGVSGGRLGEAFADAYRKAKT